MKSGFNYSEEKQRSCTALKHRLRFTYEAKKRNHSWSPRWLHNSISAACEHRALRRRRRTAQFRRAPTEGPGPLRLPRRYLTAGPDPLRADWLTDPRSTAGRRPRGPYLMPNEPPQRLPGPSGSAERRQRDPPSPLHFRGRPGALRHRGRAGATVTAITRGATKTKHRAASSEHWKGLAARPAASVRVRCQGSAPRLPAPTPRRRTADHSRRLPAAA